MILLAALALAAQPPSTGLEGSYDPTNPFAKIMRKELPAATICEDRNVLVFVPKDWVSQGEILVIPKRQVRNLLGLHPAELERLMVVVQHAALAQHKVLHSTGFQMVQNNGATSHQTVFHVHFHVIPSFGRPPDKSDFKANVAHLDLLAMAKRLRSGWPTSKGC